jgi:hypothetical protein
MRNQAGTYLGGRSWGDSKTYLGFCPHFRDVGGLLSDALWGPWCGMNGMSLGVGWIFRF